MAPVIGALPGTYFTLRMYKRLTTNPSLVWANAYEFVNRETTVLLEVQGLIAAVQNFEQLMHLPDVTFDRAVFSTWVEDGEPYDPQSFITVPLSGPGQRAALGEAHSLNYCLFLRRNTVFGQNGKLFYRRCLTELDTISPSGTPALSNPANLDSEVSTALTESGIRTYLDGLGSFQMVMKSVLLIEREVFNLTVAGARVIQFNNRYFDVP